MAKPSIRDFRRNLRVLEREVERALQAQTDCCGVSSAQCHLILTLEESGASTVGDLAARLELDPSTLSRTVDGLVKAGLAERREDPENRRRQIVTLSGSGKAKADSINSLCDRFYKKLLGSLPPAEADILVSMLPILSRALRTLRESERSVECCRLPGGPS